MASPEKTTEQQIAHALRGIYDRLYINVVDVLTDDEALWLIRAVQLLDRPAHEPLPNAQLQAQPK